MKILAIAVVVGAAFWVLPTDAEAGGLKVHGNWCGPGHGGGDTVDALDEACKRHDECYERDEYLDCMCDARLIKDISELRRLSPEETTKAALILRWFIDSPCVSPGVVEAALTLLEGGAKVAVEGAEVAVEVAEVAVEVAEVAVEGAEVGAKVAVEAVGTVIRNIRNIKFW